MIAIIDCGSQKVKYIEQAVDNTSDFQTIGLFDMKTKDLNAFDGVIISGAPILLTEIDLNPYLEAFSWVKSFEKPILGICFGHQILGLTHGAFAARQKEDRDWQTIEIYKESILFNKMPQEIEMMQDHCECVSIPKNFELIAGSDACVNEAMQHISKSFFGVQFHPEVSGTMGFLLIDNFVNYCLAKK